MIGDTLDVVLEQGPVVPCRTRRYDWYSYRDIMFFRLFREIPDVNMRHFRGLMDLSPVEIVVLAAEALKGHAHPAASDRRSTSVDLFIGDPKRSFLYFSDWKRSFLEI